MIISHLTKRGHSNLKPLINLKELLLDTEKLKRNALERKMNVNVDLIKELNGKRIEMSKELNILNSKRKKINNSISNSNLISSSISNSDSFDRKNLMKKLAIVEDDLLREISTIPNWSSEESPLTENKIIKMSPEDFNPSNHARADHVKTCKRFDLVDFEGPARTTGAHFYALKGITAMLEIALTAWSMNRAAKKGFVPVSAPDCVREKFVVGCGFQPRRSKVEESSGKKKSNLPVYTVTMPGDTETEDPLILAGTSEIFLASQYTGQTLRSPDLPLKFVGLSHCFRSEVGHHTASSRGLYRVHQFTKIELFVFCDSAHSEDHFHEITGLQGEMLSELKLPFRVLEMKFGCRGGKCGVKSCPLQIAQISNHDVSQFVKGNS